jgi:hypothetical protein
MPAVRRSGLIHLPVILPVVISCFLSGALAATTRYVSPGGADTGVCTNRQKPCRSIGYAVGQSAAGDTVSLARGTYIANVVIDKSLTLTGSGDDEASAIIRPAVQG